MDTVDEYLTDNITWEELSHHLTKEKLSKEKQQDQEKVHLWLIGEKIGTEEKLISIDSPNVVINKIEKPRLVKYWTTRSHSMMTLE